METIMNELPSTPWGFVKLLIALLPIIGRAYTAIKHEGGIRGIWKTVILGQSIK